MTIMATIISARIIPQRHCARLIACSAKSSGDGPVTAKIRVAASILEKHFINCSVIDSISISLCLQLSFAATSSLKKLSRFDILIGWAK